MPRSEQRSFLPPPSVPAKSAFVTGLTTGPVKPVAVAKPAKGKRLTLPLEDQLVLAELRDLFVGETDSRLERIAVALERIVEKLDHGFYLPNNRPSIHEPLPTDGVEKTARGIPF